MAKTRDIILDTLQTHGSLSVVKLAENAGVSPVSIRHHLSSLQASGLIESVEFRQGVGRPRLLYSLTEKAVEKRTPKKYARLSGRLLAELKNTLPVEIVSEILTNIARKRAADRMQNLNTSSFEGKLTALVEILGEEGFMAEWQQAGEEYAVTEHNCPYFLVGQQHPEICTFDQVLISEVLEVPVERTTCLLDGDDECVFVFPKPELVQIAE